MQKVFRTVEPDDDAPEVPQPFLLSRMPFILNRIHNQHRLLRTLGHLAKRADSRAKLMNLCLSESTNRHWDHIERTSSVNSSLLRKMAISATIDKKLPACSGGSTFNQQATARWSLSTIAIFRPDRSPVKSIGDRAPAVDRCGLVLDSSTRSLHPAVGGHHFSS